MLAVNARQNYEGVHKKRENFKELPVNDAAGSVCKEAVIYRGQGRGVPSLRPCIRIWRFSYLDLLDRKELLSNGFNTVVATPVVLCI